MDAFPIMLRALKLTADAALIFVLGALSYAAYDAKGIAVGVIAVLVSAFAIVVWFFRWPMPTAD